MAKSMAEINQEYNLACAQLGQEVYRVAALESEINTSERNITSLKQKLKELNEKAAKASKAAQAALDESGPSEVSNEPA